MDDLLRRLFDQRDIAADGDCGFTAISLAFASANPGRAKSVSELRLAAAWAFERSETAIASGSSQSPSLLEIARNARQQGSNSVEFDWLEGIDLDSVDCISQAADRMRLDRFQADEKGLRLFWADHFALASLATELGWDFLVLQRGSSQGVYQLSAGEANAGTDRPMCALLNDDNRHFTLLRPTWDRQESDPGLGFFLFTKAEYETALEDVYGADDIPSSKSHQSGDHDAPPQSSAQAPRWHSWTRAEPIPPPKVRVSFGNLLFRGRRCSLTKLLADFPQEPCPTIAIVPLSSQQDPFVTQQSQTDRRIPHIQHKLGLADYVARLRSRTGRNNEIPILSIPCTLLGKMESFQSFEVGRIGDLERTSVTMDLLDGTTVHISLDRRFNTDVVKALTILKDASYISSLKLWALEFKSGHADNGKHLDAWLDVETYDLGIHQLLFSGGALEREFALAFSSRYVDSNSAGLDVERCLREAVKTVVKATEVISHARRESVSGRFGMFEFADTLNDRMGDLTIDKLNPNIFNNSRRSSFVEKAAKPEGKFKVGKDVPRLADHQINSAIRMVELENDCIFRGGVLAEEMGLGKTASMLAVICHQRADQFDMVDGLGNWRVPHLRPNDALDLELLVANGQLQRVVSETSHVRRGDKGPVPAKTSLGTSVTHFLPQTTLYITTKPLLEQVKNEINRWTHLKCKMLSKTKLQNSLVQRDLGGMKNFVGFDKAVHDPLQKEMEQKKREAERKARVAEAEIIKDMSDCDIVLASFEDLSYQQPGDRERRLYPALRAVRFRRCIVDEPQQAANSFKTSILQVINANARWCVSGTPFPNNTDAANVLRFLRHPLAESFQLNPRTDFGVALLRPLVVRYFPRAALDDRKLKVLGAKVSIGCSPDIVDFDKSARRDAKIPTAVLKMLKDPATDEYNGSCSAEIGPIGFQKYDTLVNDTVPGFLAEDSRKSAVETTKLIRQLLHGSLSSAIDPDEKDMAYCFSHKILILVDILRKARRKQESVVIYLWEGDNTFVTLTGLQNILTSFAADPDEPAEGRLEPLVLRGTSREVKRDVRKAFLPEASWSANRSILILNLRTLSSGLNLQRANHVVFLASYPDAWRIDQGIARILRMGQQNKDVHIWFLTSKAYAERFTLRRILSELTNEKAVQLAHGDARQRGEAVQVDELADVDDMDVDGKEADGFPANDEAETVSMDNSLHESSDSKQQSQNLADDATPNSLRHLLELVTDYHPFFVARNREPNAVQLAACWEHYRDRCSRDGLWIVKGLPDAGRKLFAGQIKSYDGELQPTAGGVGTPPAVTYHHRNNPKGFKAPYRIVAGSGTNLEDAKLAERRARLAQIKVDWSDRAAHSSQTPQPAAAPPPSSCGLPVEEIATILPLSESMKSCLFRSAKYNSTQALFPHYLPNSSRI